MTRLMHRDVAPALILILLGAWALWQTLEMSVLGAVFPRLAGIGMLLGGLTLGARALILRPATSLQEGELTRPLLLLALLLAWAVLLPVTGFVLTSIVAATVAMLIGADERPSLKSALSQIAAIVVTVSVLALLFGQVLMVNLP